MVIVSRTINVHFRLRFSFLIARPCVRRRAHLDLVCRVWCSVPSASLLPVSTASQVWKLADTWPRELIILDPRPITPHYPLCGPLSGERHVTIARHESRRHHTALMDAPACPYLLGSPGQQTFKFYNSRRTKGALVRGHRPWPLEVKHQGVSERNTKAGNGWKKAVSNATIKGY